MLELGCENATVGKNGLIFRLFSTFSLPMHGVQCIIMLGYGNLAIYINFNINLIKFLFYKK